MKKLYVVLALVMAVAMIAGCAPAATQAPATTEAPAAATTEVAAATTQAPVATTAAAPAKKFTIGVSNGFVDSEWRTQMVQDIVDINKEYEAQGLTNDVVIENADVDVQGQIQQVRNLINKGVDAIIIDPNSNTALNDVFKEAKDAGILVIALDQEVSSPDAINVVIDQKAWAEESANWLATQLNGKGNVVVINGIAGTPGNEMRYDGVKEVFAKYPDIKVVNVINANWDQATGQKGMADLLASGTKIDGVWSQDGMARGALQAVQAANPAKWPVMVGEARSGYLKLWNDILLKNPAFVSYGVVNPPGTGGSALRIAVSLLQGKQLKDGVLAGSTKNSLYLKIPYSVDKDNFATEYAKIKDSTQEVVLDGILTQDEANAFFK